MDIQDLKSATDDYERSQREILDRRNLWRNGVKAQIIELLEKVRDKFNIGLHIQVDNDLINYESIYLSFGNSNSGIKKDEQSLDGQRRNLKAYTKSGPTLQFQLTHSGKIAILYYYPEIEEIVSPVEPVTMIEEIEPREANDSKVFGVVKEFLEEMTNWERGKPKTSFNYTWPPPPGSPPPSAN